MTTPLYPSPGTVIPFQQDWQVGHYYDRIEAFKAAPIGEDKIVFLGNSLTEGGGDWNRYFQADSLIVNRGISGDITEGVLARLDEIVHFKPRAVFLLIGINDIFDSHIEGRELITAEYVASNSLKIMETIKARTPETQLFIQTPLPINREVYENSYQRFPGHETPLKQQIQDIRTQVLQRVSRHPSFQAIDLHQAFLNKAADMDTVYTTDGVHLSRAGYQQWVEILSPYIEDMLKEK